MSVTQKMVDIGVSNSAQMQMGVLFAIAMMGYTLNQDKYSCDGNENIYQA